MTERAIRQSGGAKIISIPKAIVETLGLSVGSVLDLSIKDDQIVLKPVINEVSLENLLEGCSRENFALTDEDKEWLHATPVGKEI